MENRYINLKELLPPFFREFQELEAVMDTETKELQMIETKHNQMVDNRYIITCDEDGIVRYEKLLGIVPKEDDDLSDRIFRCTAKWNISIPYNYAMLEQKLRELCKEDYSLVLDTEEQTITIKIGISEKNQFESVVKIVAEIIPCNLLLEVSILYNQYKLLAEYPHIILKQFTQWELRNMDIPGNLSEAVYCVADYTVEDIAGYTVGQIVDYGLRIK